MSGFSERRHALRAYLVRAPARRLGLLGLGGLLFLGLLARRNPGDLPEPIRVKRADLVLAVEMEGELAAVHSSEIGAPAVNEWEFKIVLMAPEGSVVKKGDPVLGFDTEKIQRLLDQKRAELKEAEGKLEQKALEVHMRSLELDQQIAGAEADAGKSQLKAEVPEELLGRVEAEKARLEHEGRAGDLKNLRAEHAANLARADAERRTLLSQRDRARGRVVELERSIERLTQRAPQDGLVLHKADWREQKKKVGDQLWRGEVVLSIPDLREMRADAMVDEADGGQVEVGQSASLRLEARPDLDFHGRVRALAQTVRRKSWRVPAKVFKVDVELAQTDPAIMRPAMRFRGEIETGRLKSRLLLPRGAIFLRDAGPIVQVRRALGWTEVKVKLGRSNRDLVEAVEGLSEGDQVLPFDLRAGSPEARATQPSLGGGR